MAELYERVAVEHPQVEFIRESDFHTDIRILATGSEFILFLVDDTLFVQPFEIDSLCHLLGRQPDAIGFSLRLGTNIQHCYPINQPQCSPHFETIEPGILRYTWPAAEHDFGYPLEISSSLYRTIDILPLLEELSFSNPNTFEAQLAATSARFVDQHSTMLCAEHSLGFCTPINKVQTVYNNRSGETPRYSIDNLARIYADGCRVNVAQYFGVVPTACHQEVELSIDTPPLVSVIIPCYNQAKFLAEAIESVVLQSFESWECIIVDDGSPDNTESVAKTVIQRNFGKSIRLIRQPNGGVSTARNIGISVSRGKYILPLDADDKLHKDYLTETVSTLKNNPDYSIVYVDEQNFGTKNHLHAKGTSSLESLKRGNVHDYCSLFRREVWERQGGYSPAMYLGGEDWNFWVGAANLGFRSIHLAKPLFHYRNYERSTTPGSQGNPNIVWSHLETHANLELVWSHIVMHHPQLYTAAETKHAQIQLSKVPQEHIRRIKRMLEAHSDNRMLRMFLDAAISGSRSPAVVRFG
jgi:glycosyltransferase involved in cell wall biosynthesis